MCDLAEFAKGGSRRSRPLEKDEDGFGAFLNGGVLWGMKGKDGILNDIQLRVELREEQASHWPFLKPKENSSMNSHSTNLILTVRTDT
jgi:hypothetical protein